MRTVYRWPALAVAMVVAGVAAAGEPEIKAAEGRMRRDLTFLASDQCEGRGPTTRGIHLAADHIAAEFKKAGLKPGGLAGTYFQHFSIPGSRLVRTPSLVLRGPQGQEITLKPGVHFHGMGLGHSGSFEDRPVVFAGYGISASKKANYDDYADVDVSGRVVVVLRDRPSPANRFAPLDGEDDRRHRSLTGKMERAEREGALAVLFVNDADTAKDGDDLLNFNFTAVTTGSNPAKAKLPAFHIRRAVLEQMMRSSTGADLSDVEKAIDHSRKPHSARLRGWTATLDMKVRRDGIDVKNVIGVLEGKGPLADETVVVGAHYDHLGYGGYSSLSMSKKMAIHNGADDNASGTAALIEMARRFAASPKREGRRLVFIAFTAEELGLIGAQYYIKEPVAPLSDTVAMVNLDMVGRLAKNPKTGKEKLEVGGVGTAKGFDKLAENLCDKYGFELKPDKGGFGPSDHSEFYGKKIPVLFFFSGMHADYHAPGDDSDKINYDGMRRITAMAEDVTSHLASVTPRPEYIKVEGSTFGPRPGITLGIRPGSYGSDDGILIAAVSEGGRAHRAGLKADDVIVEMDGKPIKNMAAYMSFLGGKKFGDSVNVGILRDKKKLLITVKLD